MYKNNWCVSESCHRSPAAADEGCADCDLALPVTFQFDPSYTLIWFAEVSNHNSPLIGEVGADVPAEFYSNLTRFSFKPSPNPE